MSSYEEDFPLRAPPPFGEDGRALFASIGKHLDLIASLARDAALARLPGVGPTDALKYIGQDRQIPQGSTETASAYSARLQDAWSIWGGDNTPGTGKGGGAGSPLGLLNALKAAGFPTGSTGATIVQQCGRASPAAAVRGYAQLDSSGNLVLGALMTCQRQDLTGAVNPRSGWTFGPYLDNFYSIFGLLFPAVTTIDRGLLNSVVEKWRPAKALFVGTWVLTSGGSWGWPVSDTWGSGNWGGDTTTFYAGPNGEADRIGYYHP